MILGVILVYVVLCARLSNMMSRNNESLLAMNFSLAKSVILALYWVRINRLFQLQLISIVFLKLTMVQSTQIEASLLDVR